MENHFLDLFESLVGIEKMIELHIDNPDSFALSQYEHKRDKIRHDLMEHLKMIDTLVKKYPNDQDLGKNIRSYLLKIENDRSGS